MAVGCTKVDADCKYCYMYRDSLNATRYEPKNIVRTKTVFDMPLRYKETKSQAWSGRPLMFTSSLTDFFHEQIDPYRKEAWDIIRRSPHIIFQILTKRPERILQHLPPDWGNGWDNVWLGTSIGSQVSIKRLNDLILPIGPGIKFLSLEPLHGKIDLPFSELVDFGHRVKDLIDWVIVGGESSNDTGKYQYRPCEIEWIEQIVSDCQLHGVPVFVKQLGTHLAKRMGLSRHGGIMEEWPKHLQIREFPPLNQSA